MPSTADHLSHRRRTKAAGFFLVTAALLGAVVGLVLLFSPTAFGVSAATGTIAGSVVLVASVVEFIAGTRAYQGQNVYGTVAGTVLGFATVFTLPLDLFATFLVVFGEHEFE